MEDLLRQYLTNSPKLKIGKCNENLQLELLLLRNPTPSIIDAITPLKKLDISDISSINELDDYHFSKENIFDQSPAAAVIQFPEVPLVLEALPIPFMETFIIPNIKVAPYAKPKMKRYVFPRVEENFNISHPDEILNQVNIS